MQKKSQSSTTDDKKCDQVETRFFAGDWNDMDHILPHVLRDESGGNCEEEPDRQPEGYDIILMAETVYSISSLPNLYKLIKKVTFIFLVTIRVFKSHTNFFSHLWVFLPHMQQCLSRPHGVVYMAAKKHYFGVGGGSRRFISLVEKDCELLVD